MTTASQPTLREQVEDFLFKEAALLDDWRLDDWVDLFTDDGRYVVPTTDLPDGDPRRDLVFIDDDINRLRGPGGAVEQQTRPPGISVVADPAVHLQRAGGGNRGRRAGGVVQRAGLSVPGGRGRIHTWAAVHYILRRDDGAFRIAYRRAVLDLEALSWHGAVSIIF